MPATYATPAAMIPPFISAIVLLLGHGLAWLGWRLFVPVEVAKNDRDIDANGSQDSLRKAYHLRRTLLRGMVAVSLVLAGSFAASLSNLPSYLLSCAALLVGLSAYFARYFTPLLNLARAARGRTDITEWYASPDSASWPDAAAWKETRSERALMWDAAEEQLYANAILKQLLTRTYRLGLACYALLLTGAVALLFLK